MDPVAFEIFGIKIRWYGIFIATAFFLGTLLASKEAKRRGINEEEIIDLALFAIPAALIGARAYYVILHGTCTSTTLLKSLTLGEEDLPYTVVLLQVF